VFDEQSGRGAAAVLDKITHLGEDARTERRVL
jgi:hypothetical protein